MDHNPLVEQAMERQRTAHEGCESLDLYRAVFDGGCADYDAALAWIRAHPRAAPFAAWQPVQRSIH